MIERGTIKTRTPKTAGMPHPAPSASLYFPEKCGTDILSTNIYSLRSGPPATRPRG
jgi:hypothetical protein